MITKEEYMQMKDKVRAYARSRNYAPVQINLLEDMLDMMLEEYNWKSIQKSFSSPRVARWTREQLVNAGVEGAKLIEP